VTVGWHPARKVRAIDVTLSCPKSVSLLWPRQYRDVGGGVARGGRGDRLRFLEERAARRQQQGGVRRRVGTDGFAHCDVRAPHLPCGDLQLHTHCLIPNVVRRADGEHVAFDANPLHVWAKAAGTIFQNDLERILSDRPGWRGDPNETAAERCSATDQLRTFSKRTAAIETRLKLATSWRSVEAERMR
jgi:hypothetical protein